MQKLTAQQATAINLLMLNTIKSYIATYVRSDEDLDNLTMYAQDVAHNITALQMFNSTADADALQNSIMLQDTLVREYFYTTLLYLEQQNLVTQSVLV